MLSNALLRVNTPSVTYNNSYSSTTNASSYTFSASAIGTADSTRLVVVVAHTNNLSASVSSMTIGGISATSAVSAGSAQLVSIWYAIVPTGTTADIVLTLGATSNNAVIGVYSLYHIVSTTPTTSNNLTVGGTSNATNTSVKKDGIIIAGITGSTNSTTTWTNATENYDTAVESTVRSGANSVLVQDNASYTTTAVITVSGNFTQVAAAWR